MPQVDEERLGICKWESYLDKALGQRTLPTDIGAESQNI